MTLGDSLVDTRLRGGALATIYVNRVATLAGRCDVDVQTLLARAVAHEIGHLLLGTSAHASSGLMRAAWSQAIAPPRANRRLGLHCARCTLDARGGPHAERRPDGGREGRGVTPHRL